MLQIWKSNIVATQNVAEKKEPTNLMFAEPKKNLIGNISRTYSTNLSQSQIRKYLLQEKIRQILII